MCDRPLLLGREHARRHQRGREFCVAQAPKRGLGGRGVRPRRALWGVVPSSPTGPSEVESRRPLMTDHPTEAAKGIHVLHRIRKRLSYANVMSTLAVFVALGGSSYAAFTLDGAAIRNRSIAGNKLRHNTLTGVQIKESRRGRVPRAKTADTLSGITVCVERTPRPAASYGSGDHMPRRRHTRWSRTTASDARRAPRCAHRRSTRARRRTDLKGVSLGLHARWARRPLHHRPGRQRCSADASEDLLEQWDEGPAARPPRTGRRRGEMICYVATRRRESHRA